MSKVGYDFTLDMVAVVTEEVTSFSMNVDGGGHGVLTNSGGFTVGNKYIEDIYVTFYINGS